MCISEYEAHTILNFLQFYNFQALLNHSANACSCFTLKWKDYAGKRKKSFTFLKSKRHLTEIVRSVLAEKFFFSSFFITLGSQKFQGQWNPDRSSFRPQITFFE
jgi:hypothetical protein